MFYFPNFKRKMQTVFAAFELRNKQTKKRIMRLPTVGVCLYFLCVVRRMQKNIFVFVHFAFWILTCKQKVISETFSLLCWFENDFDAVFVFVLFEANSQWTQTDVFYAFNFCAPFYQLFFIDGFAYAAIAHRCIDRTIIIFKLLFDFGKCCFCFRLSAMITLNQSNKRFPIAVICCGLQSDDFVATGKKNKLDINFDMSA